MSAKEKAAQPETLETQIAIVGAGAAGLAAAVAATENGADVIVLEKRSSPGGNAARAEGLLAAESPVQKRFKIDAQRDVIFKMAMEHAHWKLNSRIVRTFVDRSGDTIQWLEDKGVVFSRVPHFYPNQLVRTWHLLSRGGIELVEILVKDGQNHGVRLIKETAARKLLTDRKGNMTGIVAATKDKELRIMARSVIIATGGYGGNKELLKKYCPQYNENMFCGGLPHMGDGLLMAIAAGAATEGLGLIQFSGHAIPGAPVDLVAVADELNTVWVNKKGERFTDEATSYHRFESINAVIRQPDSFCYTLFDERIKQNIIEEGIIKGVGTVVPPRTKLTGLGKALELEADKGNAKIAASWGEIADWIGIKPVVLKATIDEYNAFCDDGYDRLFAKDRRYLDALRTPPYYALRCYPRFLSTIGGIKINHRMEVLDREDNPIPGLYAAGVDTGGWEADTYNAVLSGTAFAFSVNSGRIAAENAARYMLGK
jgi:fumarate reductase flavoprotein subunit